MTDELTKWSICRPLLSSPSYSFQSKYSVFLSKTDTDTPDNLISLWHVFLISQFDGDMTPPFASITHGTSVGIENDMFPSSPAERAPIEESPSPDEATSVSPLSILVDAFAIVAVAKTDMRSMKRSETIGKSPNTPPPDYFSSSKRPPCWLYRKTIL